MAVLVAVTVLGAEVPAQADTAHLVASSGTGQRQTLIVHSAAMDRDITVAVSRAADNSVPRPTLYLLDGDYRSQVTDMNAFLADKNVNVVSPSTSADNYWADWKQPSPEGFVYKWETFVTRELPPIIDKALGTNGVNGIAGMSRTGTAALRIAAKNPGKYKAVAAYSACAQTSDPAGEMSVRMTMQHIAGLNADAMWGPSGDPTWAANDAYVHAEGLRGSTIYVSSGTGLPGPNDRIDGPGLDGSVGSLANQILLGGGIEAATDLCTAGFATRLTALGIPAKFNFKPVGNHSWGYWQEDLKESWPTIERGLGV
jgi:diacylglycerol O-acyltransferase/trehalose O-mycolyltransferase